MRTELNDEISFWEIVDFLKEGWRWLSSGVALGLVCAVVYFVVTPKQFEATAIIQPATVGMPTATVPTATTTKGAEVEPVAQTLERLKIATFYTVELVEACQAPSAQILATSIKANLVKGNALILLSYRAASAVAAKACINAVVRQLAKSQAAIAAPVIKTLEEQLVLTRQRLRDEKAYQEQVEKRAASSADGVSLLMLKALSKREELAQLQKQLVEQSVQLSAPITQPLQLLEPIDVSERAVFPKKLPTLAAGLFGGLVLGGLAFFVRRSWLVRKSV